VRRGVNIPRCRLYVDVLLIHQQGKPAAWVANGRIELYPRIAILEAEHPSRRWAMCTAIFAMEILAGRIRDPFDQGRADHFARSALMPDGEFRPLVGAGDAAVAEHFNVPLDQVREKRLDLLSRDRSALAASHRQSAT
jgi:hypothetical protein